MQWSSAASAGFTTAPQSWLPIAPDFTTCNVARQTKDPRSHLALYRQLIWYRKRSPALTRGTYRPLDTAADSFSFLREYAGERRLIVLNFAAEHRSMTLPGMSAGQLDVSTDPDRQPGPTSLANLQLGPVEGVIISL